VDELESLSEAVISNNGAAADHVTVPVEVLRRRMEDDVGTQIERALEVRRGERIVDDQERALSVRDVGNGGDIRQPHQRIAWCFQ
jgi:hypothetical protein